MEIAIVVITHGSSAEPLCKTAEMIVGQQENLAVLDFYPGENVDSLAIKINKSLRQLNTDNGLLFLVDVFGGSPFNAAMLVSSAQRYSDVVSGVNIPMLIDCFMDRNTVKNFSDLVDVAKSSGIAGILSMNQDMEFNNRGEDL
ncbi:mannose/fructose/sorbose PTS transporter subunit IIA [Klebsiella quasipneumoniae]|uniref:mannose/fructose/sorbose PTS transporter subunit IIA n=1 Tax=Klebsiella quasipneumoniae TaxID=1463165 RepID=UPI000C7C55A1|nr:PTS N'-diacetylchitobiose transporter subunit IIB [Escherichia coli]MBM5553108.1 PTS N'-diacetylchitobiose transporter subunit IIB [Klebsiella quasipneumoniae]UNA35068.1 mannose/fructose/sorbose PTS transporter subunit IIA [Klebsiella variicola subsp. variicola]MBM5559034.1 PTS N'-diacetylchitobiose transporter subunit IIB [Klebsiella quasipneumoniae]MCJ4451406.1 mannose/fructose/sorbose PTS transporter subunit IIA [Klebsiella quasipneumoniae]